MIDVEIEQDVFLPCYHHLLEDNDFDIEFLWGSRDSGKSQFIAQKLLMDCMQMEYFRLLLIRKTFNTIKDSQWQTVKDIADNWGVEHLFKFNKNPLEIHCINGNKMVARGMDDPAKVKSFRNPNVVWVEEADQLTADDWILLITSLRTEIGKVKIYCSFNPQAEGDFRQFWLYKDYFASSTELSFKSARKIEVGNKTTEIKFRSTHTTYKDNPYCSPQRIATYEDLKFTSPYHYRTLGLGLWGNKENKSPFILTFDRNKHLTTGENKHLCQYNPSKELYLIFDFNRNPMCCSVVQDDGNAPRWIEVIKIPNSTIYEMCEQIKIRYPDAFYIVFGDGSGISQSALIKENDLNNYYKVIKQELNLVDGQLQYEVNPPLENNRLLCNYCFRHLDILLNPDTCQPLIYDIEFGEVMADGKLRKGDREDPAQQLDALDTMRYYLNKKYSHLTPEV